MKKFILILMLGSLFIGCATKGGATLGCSTKSCLTKGCATKGCSKKSCATKGCSKSCCANKAVNNTEPSEPKEPIEPTEGAEGVMPEVPEVQMNILDGEINSGSITLKTEDIIKDCKIECTTFTISSDEWCDCMNQCSQKVIDKISFGDMNMKVYIEECP